MCNGLSGFSFTKNFLRLSIFLFLVAGLFLPSLAAAINATGVPVNAMGSTTQVGIIDANGEITYYIPMSPGASGIYGVDGNGDVGTTPDSGSAGGSLRMFLAFGPLTTPIASAQLHFDFEDLDLNGSADGGSFRETIRFIGSDGSTPVIDDITDDTATYQITGNSSTQAIHFFSLAGVSNLSNQQYLFLEVDFATLHVNGGNTSEALKATLSYTPAPVYQLSGQALLQGANTPIQGVTIQDAALGSTSTDAGGNYNFQGVQNGTYTLTANKPGYIVVSHPNPVVINGANVTNANFILACATGFVVQNGVCVPTYSISGLTLLQGSATPLAGVTVTSDSGLGSILTAQDGAFSYSGLTNGSYSFSASAPGYVVVSHPNPVVVNGANVTNANFILACAPGFLLQGSQCVAVYSIQGQVRMQGSNQPVSGVQITGSSSLGTTTSSVTGMFLFNQATNGSYTLSLLTSEYLIVSHPNPVVVNGANVINADFIVTCLPGYTFIQSDGRCMSVNPPLDIEASDGTSPDHVEVVWTGAPCASNYVLYRSEKSGNVFSNLLMTAQPVPAQQNRLYYDTSAIPGVTYYYGSIALDNNGNECSRSDIDPGYRLSDEKDCDGDGISDDQEAADGTDPCDRGSNIPRLHSPAFAKWNSFLTQANYLELLATGNKDVWATVTVYSINGEVRDTAVLQITPGNQIDVDINAMAGEIDTYGIVRIDWNDKVEGAHLNGRMSVYRPDPTGGTYSFAFARELINPVSGPQYATGNSIDPQGQGFTVPNWAEIINVEKGSQTFTYNLYDQSGVLIQTEEVTMPGLSERDINAGHEFGQGTFLSEVIPHDASKQFYFTVARYSSNHIGGDEASTYNFAFARRGQAGTGAAQYAPISNEVGGCWSQTNWVEIVNVLQTPVTARLTFHGDDGSLIDSTSLPLAPHAQYHFPGSALLAKGARGSVKLTGSSANSLLMQSLVYFHDCESNLTQSAYLSPGRVGGRKNQMGSYNRFLGMSNWLVLLNTTNDNVDYTVMLRSFGADVGSFGEELAADVSSFHDLGNSEVYNTTQDTYGTVALSTADHGTMSAEVVRVRTNPDNPAKIDFAFQTEIR